MSQQHGFFFQHSNDVRRLADGMAELIAERQRLSPLSPMQITVPHPGVGIWLTQHLARRRSVCANLQFIQPTQLIWQLAGEVYDPQVVRLVRGLDSPAIMLGLYQILRQTDAGCLEAIESYLSESESNESYSEKHRLGLARELALLFRDYVFYRPEWIDAWSRGKDVEELRANPDRNWQARLWQQLWMNTGADRRFSNPGKLLLELAPRLATIDGVQLFEPKPILLFGIAHLPPVFLDAMAGAAQSRGVHLYMPNPCRAYWGDVESERARLSREVKEAGAREPARLIDDLIPNDLLGSMGRQGQEFLTLVYDRLNDQQSEFAEVGYRENADERNRLGWIQNALLELEQPEPGELSKDDSSIQIHCCHSRLREVEVLHDRVLTWLDARGPYADRRYRPRDILVVAPDIDTYAPFVRAVFSANLQDRPGIPLNISDRRDIDAHPLIQVFLELLDLPISDFSSETIVSMLETPAIARRFNLDESEFDSIRRWAAETHVHWGLDARHRVELGAEVESSANTWRHTTDRLLFGFANNQDSSLLEFDGTSVLPFNRVEGSSGEAAGKLSLWINLLQALRNDLQRGPDTIQGWQRFINARIISDLFDVPASDHDEASALDIVRNVLGDLRAASERAACEDLTLSWAIVRELLKGALTDSLGRRRFLSCGITFTSTVPLRSVPGRIICMLGMNSGEFPRSTRPESFDLINQRYRQGDRTRRSEDRYLFLETLMAAEDILYLSFLGRDQRENKPIEPSQLVREIEDYLQRAEKPLQIIGHPMQPFSRMAFKPALRETQSHHREWLPAARNIALAASAAGSPENQRFFSPRQELPDLPHGDNWPTVIRLDQLQRFLRAPAEYYFRNTLQIKLDDIGSQLSSEFQSDPLSNYKVKDYAARLAIENGGVLPDDIPNAVERARAWLPAGSLARILVEKRHQSEMSESVCDVLEDAGPASTIEIDLQLDLKTDSEETRSIRLIGTVDNIHEHYGGIIRWAPSAFQGRRCAQFLAPWLALNASRHQNQSGHPFSFVDGRGKLHVFHPVGRDQSLTWLNDLVVLFLRGQVAPIPFFPESAWIRKREGDDDKSSRRFFGSDSGFSSERELNPYFGLITRDWEPSDLLGGQFQLASTIVFRNPTDYYEMRKK